MQWRATYRRGNSRETEGVVRKELKYADEENSLVYQKERRGKSCESPDQQGTQGERPLL